ncbi:MAG: hypothetical protein ABI572_02725 [Actinomycetota bacterium]
MRTRSTPIVLGSALALGLATMPILAPPASAACPRYGPDHVAGNVHIAGINEISGVVAGRRWNVLWAEEDSGNPERVYAVSPTGRTRANMEVRNATNHDWEDITYGGGRIWLGDIGSRRNVVQVYWFPEPRLGAHAVRAKGADLRYEQGATHNAEAMFILGTNLFVVTKERSGWQGLVYRAGIRGLRAGGARTMHMIGRVTIGNVTGADAGPLGFIVRNLSGTAEFYPWRGGRSVTKALRGAPCDLTVGRGESIAFSRWKTRLYSISEGTNPAVRYVARR